VTGKAKEALMETSSSTQGGNMASLTMRTGTRAAR
jgi:hypothetical protein